MQAVSRVTPGALAPVRVMLSRSINTESAPSDRYACQFCQYRASRLEHRILRVLRNLRRGPRFAQTSSRS